jgi:putative transcriptional regulator
MKQSPLKNRVYKFRGVSELTQVQLAKAVGVTRQTIISIEKGNYEPSVRLALRLATELDVTVEQLFYETLV